MAEQEVIKHAQNAISVLKDGRLPVWQKIKESLYEIAIIVFAVSISIWFHNLSEERHTRAEVKEFLTGLKIDLAKDSSDVAGGLDAFKDYKWQYQRIANGNPDVPPGKDTLNQLLMAVNSTFTLHPHQARYNGFLASGKITNISDYGLQSDILNYYQYTIPTYLTSESGWISVAGQYWMYRASAGQNFDDDKEMWKVMASSRGRYYARVLTGIDQLEQRLDTIRLEGRIITKKIDSLYGE